MGTRCTYLVMRRPCNAMYAATRLGRLTLWGESKRLYEATRTTGVATVSVVLMPCSPWCPIHRRLYSLLPSTRLPDHPTARILKSMSTTENPAPCRASCAPGSSPHWGRVMFPKGNARMCLSTCRAIWCGRNKIRRFQVKNQGSTTWNVDEPGAMYAQSDKEHAVDSLESSCNC